MSLEQPTNLEEVLLQAIQLMPTYWSVEIIVERGEVHISLVDPEGQDADFNTESNSTAQLVMNALAQACYTDMKDGVSIVKMDEPITQESES